MPWCPDQRKLVTSARTIMQVAFTSPQSTLKLRACNCRNRLRSSLHAKHRPPRCRITASAKASAADRLAEVADTLRLKNVRLQQLVKEEEYQQAAQHRDSITQLELEKRRLEIEANQEARAKVAHDVGQVIRHKRYEYRGVIVGYDPVCIAPEGWIKAMRVDSLSKGRNQPFYHVLVDDRDRNPPGSVTYVAQENIATIRGQTQVEHPLIHDYFKGFEDGQYIPTERMREQYPQRAPGTEG